MEMLNQEQADARYGKKGVAGTGLGLGIAGTALGLLNGGLGNIFGGLGNNANSGICATPSLWQICEKQAAENVALTSAIYQARIKEMEDLNGVYQAVNTRLVELEKKDAALSASLPLAMQISKLESERYTDKHLSKAEKEQCAMNFYMQNEISKKVNGTMGLNWSDIISGVPKMPNCTLDVSCPNA